MNDDLKALLGQVLTKLDNVATKDDVAELGVRVSRLEAGQDELRTQVAVVQQTVEEMNRTTSANHFRTMGRIDELRNMLRGDHGPAPVGGDIKLRAEPEPQQSGPG